MGIVMLADNDRRFLKHRADLLRTAGFKVVTAGSLEEAERILGEGYIHVAILDVRLVSDEDTQDVSGLILAKRSEFRTIPKILLTGFPSYETVRDAMSGDEEGVPPAVDFVWKHEEAAAMVKAVHKSFSLHVQLDEQLVIRFGKSEPVSFSNLASWLDPSLSGERLSHHTAVLEKLFGQLFYKKSEIRIGRSLWKYEGRAALIVYSYTQGRPIQAQVVVCGQSASVVTEATRYKEFAPEAPGASGTVLVKTVETQHFAANVYALAGTKIDNVHTLTESYHKLPERTFKVSLEHLFDHTLAPWQSERSVAGEGRSLGSLYRELLGLGDGAEATAEMRKRVGALARQLPRLGVTLEEGPSAITLHIGARSFTYPHPGSRLCSDSAHECPPLLANTPGDLSGENILADAEGRTWLSQFAQAGPKPLLWNYTALETVVRFDWVESDNIVELHQLEVALTDPAFTSIKTEDVEQRLRKPLRVIGEIRRHARRAAGPAWREYQLGLYYHAARRLISLEASPHMTDNELVKVVHVVMAQAMICDSLKPKGAHAPAAAGIHIDYADHAVTVDGRSVHLSPQSYDLLLYFHGRNGQLCTRKEIFERVFTPETYDAGDDCQERKLNTSITRLRKKIEENPDKPRYLVTIQGVGYKLVS